MNQMRLKRGARPWVLDHLIGKAVTIILTDHSGCCSAIYLCEVEGHTHRLWLRKDEIENLEQPREQKPVHYYEVWVKPESGPLVFQERAEDGQQLVWPNKDHAVARAKQLRQQYPNIHFIVRQGSHGYYRDYAKVFDTSLPEGV